MTALEWVVFDVHGPLALADDSALIRWGQAHGYKEFNAWRADAGSASMMPCVGRREGPRWVLSVPRDHAGLEPQELIRLTGTEAAWHVPADPSDDPRALRIVDRIEAGAASAVLETVRWTAGEWPPEDLHADADPNQIGQKLGSLYDIGVVDDDTIARYWHYCPERIAVVAESLNDEQLSQVLDYLEGRVSLTMVNERLEPHDRERFIDQTFLEPNPELQELLTKLLLRAMDLAL